MRELVYYVAVSLDGYIARPDGSFDAFAVEGDHMSVVLGDYRDALPTHVLGALDLAPTREMFDTVVMGWKTYAVGFDQGIESPYTHLRQFVFSRTRPSRSDGITVTADDPVSVVRDLKSEATGSDIWLCGGGNLAASLVDEIDRLVLKVNPVMFGSGIPLFAAELDPPRTFALAASTSFDSGVTISEYGRI